MNYTPTPKVVTQPKGLTDEKAQRIMLGLREGKTPRELWVRPGQLEAYFSGHPEFAREARPLIEANGKAARARKGDYFRSKTHCKRGHPLTPDNVYLFPYRNALGRKCKLCTKLHSEAPPLPTEDQVKRVTAALNSGQTLNLICTGKVAGKIVASRIMGFNKLKVYRARNPDFDKFIRAATEDHNSNGQLRRWNSQPTRTDQVRAQNNDYYKIRELVPRHLPDDVRDDIAQSVFLALFEGTLQRDQVDSRVRQFVQDHNRMFPTKFAKFGDSPLLSLDEVMFEDGAATRGDSVSRGLWD
ncbi:hypothetical protein IF803_23145 [Bradyrhizobium sp. UFLA06-06]